MSTDVLDKTSVESWCEMKSGVDVHAMERVTQYILGFVLDSR